MGSVVERPQTTYLTSAMTHFSTIEVAYSMKRLDTEDAQDLHKQRQAMYEAADRYRQSFIDSHTKLIHSKYTEWRNCPVCDSGRHRSLFNKNGGQYVICNECEMIFLNPVLKDLELAEYYKNNNEIQSSAHENESAFYRRIYSAGLDMIATVKAKGSLLDIGCSGGFFLDIAKERGFVTHGVELNKAEVRIASSKGHVVWGVPIQQTPDSQSFDVITLWDVFEHIKNGISYLTHLRSRLAVGGLLFLQIPSANSLAARIIREKCNVFDGVEHVNLYSSNTLERIANASGFKIVSIKSVIDELKPVLNYLNYDDPYTGAFAENRSFEFLTPELIHEKLLGYKLQVVLIPV